MWKGLPGNLLYLFKVSLLFLLIFFGKSCETVKEARLAGQNDHRSVLLISLDGFRQDYLNLGLTPVLDSLSNAGVRSEGLIPVFPSKTFPNHFTQVTGLYPENHGIVSNRMFDSTFSEYFSIGENSSSASDGKWYQGEPIWVTAKKQGLTTATMFWPGSDAEISGMRPDFYFPYNPAIRNEDRVTQVLEWLDMGAHRPHLITLYFEQIDRVGHVYGPDSQQIGNAITEMEGHLLRLTRSITDLGYREKLDLVIVSDHGMIAQSRSKVIFLDDYIDLGLVEVINWSPITEIIPQPGLEQEIYDGLRGSHECLQVYRKGQVPEKWHYNHHSRITPIIAVADPGWSVTSSDFFQKNAQAFTGGTHGYDPVEPEMHGIFIAAGPSFKSDIVLPPVSSIHLYELLCKLLGIEAAANHGSLKVWTPALVPVD